MLVAGALNMALYFTRLLHTQTGMNPDHTLSMDVSLSPLRYAGDEHRWQFFDRLLDRLKGVPGVTAVAASSVQPFTGGGQSSDFEYEGQPAGSSVQLPFADNYFVTAGFFEAVQTPILQGRSFNQHDQAAAPKVVIINRTMAETLWPGQAAVGKRLKINGDWHQVIGMTGDVRAAGISQPAGFQIYLSAAQHPVSDMTLLMRTTAEPLSLAEAAKQAVYAIDPEQAVSNVAPLDQLASQSIAGERVSAALTGSLGALALLLACVGVYGVMAYSVSRREREFGIRLAMGATPSDILVLLLRHSSYLVLIGITAGAILTIPLSRWVRALLVGPHGFSAPIVAAAGLLLAAVALCAAYLPARRAASTQPMQALRME
jgi:putative ABC transport system permease protein